MIAIPGIATLQMVLVWKLVPTPKHFIFPILVATIAAFLLASFAAMRKEVQKSQRKFKAVTDLAQEFVYLRRKDGSYEYVSPSCEALTGYTAEEFYSRPSFMTSLVHPDDRPLWDSHVHQMDNHGNPEKLKFRILTKRGEVRWVRHLCSDMRDESGKILGVRSANLDITESVLRQQELELSSVAFQTHEAILITDGQSRILRVNNAFTETTGYTAEEVVGKTPAVLKSGCHDEAFYAEMWNALKSEGSWSGEIWDRRKNGEVYPKYMTITSVRGVSGEVLHYVGSFSDISARKEAEEEIKRLAYYDYLTNLPNRRLMVKRLQQAFSASDRHGRRGALLLIDLDNFKILNDTRGHDAGDKLLIEVAQRLQASVREEDTVARLGGDEFVVMLEDLNPDSAEAVAQVETVAEKILTELNRPYLFEGYSHQGGASMGVALFSGRNESVDDLLKHADVALYRAKAAGRATIRFFDPRMQELIEERATMERDLRQALDKKQFELHYQPQVGRDGTLLGAEVLLRWKHPHRGMVSPSDFIPFAEECGMITEIGRWVLVSACDQLKQWQDEVDGQHLRLSINVSARQFREADFANLLLGQVRDSGVRPEHLKLELTEGALIDDMDDAIRTMQTLREAGVGFSLDDFGTGYSSLSYLRHLPLDQLKIDRSFVSDIGANAHGAVIAQTIIGMARNLGLKVIAEGVETSAQLEFLDQNECHAYQGYYFARPLPATDFSRLIRDPSTLREALSAAS